MQRSSTAEEAIDLISNLVSKHVSDADPLPKYAFVLCDPISTWLLNIVGKQWGAEKIEDTFKCIGSGITIASKIDRKSDVSVRNILISSFKN